MNEWKKQTYINRYNQFLLMALEFPFGTVIKWMENDKEHFYQC